MSVYLFNCLCCERVGRERGKEKAMAVISSAKGTVNKTIISVFIHGVLNLNDIKVRPHLAYLCSPICHFDR